MGPPQQSCGATLQGSQVCSALQFFRYAQKLGSAASPPPFASLGRLAFGHGGEATSYSSPRGKKGQTQNFNISPSTFSRPFKKRRNKESVFWRLVSFGLKLNGKLVPYVGAGVESDFGN
ncbi:hypothetical protein SGRA_4078 [Saprospira grandis str. Lewin]|uniref:Uncharacterized protein n=1 Tax=Saprospira grandis (strain Lewin) TaxID=984262 RepID=H6L7C1_SAPGL|nr:hypothetical protein SGRA_4078 [Saprospira grandis str. Lewin]